MKRMNDPRVQRLLAYVVRDTGIAAMAQQAIQADLMAIDADLTAAREAQEQKRATKGAK
jgi:hypothetical protein